VAKRKKASGNAVPEWVVTYGDLMSLLLCFFILLAAFSELKKEDQWRKVLEEIKEAFGFEGGVGVTDSDMVPSNSIAAMLSQNARLSTHALEANIAAEDSVTGRHNRSAIVQEGQRFAVGGSIPFDEGSDQLTRAAMDTLKTEVAPKIRGQRFVVQIVGHAWGDRELLSGFGLDEIAYRRAQAVKDYLVRECGVDQMILRVESAGATEPLSLSASPVEIPPGNRRVQIWQTGRTVDQTHPDANFTGVTP
jgi:chemotaxis protein MotB